MPNKKEIIFPEKYITDSKGKIINTINESEDVKPKTSNPDDFFTSFPPKHFNDSGDIGKSLLTKESSIVFYKRKDNPKLYEGFFDNYGPALARFPQHNIKQIVQDVYNRNDIHLGHSITAEDDVTVCSRVLVNQKNSTLISIVLNDSYLDINMVTGKPNNVDKCIYSTYYGIIRAIVLLNSAKIYKDYDLHKLLISYLQLLILKVLGKRLLESGKQKKLILMACSYIYFRHFLQQQHLMALSNTKAHFGETLTKEFIHEYIPFFDVIKKYNSIKDIGKILIDLKIIREDPSKIILDMFNVFKKSGFYGLTTALDIFITMCCLSRYPQDLFAKSCMTIDKIHSNVENIILNYFKNIKLYNNDSVNM